MSSTSTKIEWTERTWNPVRGCLEVSPGCARCYASTFAERFRGVAGHPYEQGFDPRLVPEKLGEPLGWKKPRRVFVNSMSDLFGEWVSDDFIAAVFGVMAACPQHTFQILTKRAERLPGLYMLGMMAGLGGDVRASLAEHAASVAGCTDPDASAALVRAARNLPLAEGDGWPLRNVWVGVSVENRKHGVPRIEHLRATDAAVRFLSVEPLLEDLGDVDLSGIGWVIVGGESGPGARRCDHAWLRRIVAQCDEQSVPVFVKQLGARQSYAGGVVPASRLNRKGGDLAAMPTDLQRREWPRAAVGQ